MHAVNLKYKYKCILYVGNTCVLTIYRIRKTTGETNTNKVNVFYVFQKQKAVIIAVNGNVV